MSTFILYYAVLESTVLALTIAFSRSFSVRPIPFISTNETSMWKKRWAGASGLLLKDTTLKALITLSPVLSYLLGSPLFSTMAKTVQGGG